MIANQLEYALTVYCGNLDTVLEYYYIFKDAAPVFEGDNLVIIKYKDRLIRFEFWPEYSDEVIIETQWTQVKGQLSLLLSGSKKE